MCNRSPVHPSEPDPVRSRTTTALHASLWFVVVALAAWLHWGAP